MQEGAKVPSTLPFRRPCLCIWCKFWRIHVMADIFLRFKLRVEVNANEIQYDLVSNRL